MTIQQTIARMKAEVHVMKCELDILEPLLLANKASAQHSLVDLTRNVKTLTELILDLARNR